jgi:hypothetical protein
MQDSTAFISEKRELFVTYKVSVGSFEGKRQPGRPRHRCEVNIKENLNGMNYRIWTEPICCGRIR